MKFKDPVIYLKFPVLDFGGGSGRKTEKLGVW